MIWDEFPAPLKERYEDVSAIEYGPAKISILENMNKNCLPLNPGSDSKSYEIFASQFNSTMLVAHIFENMMVLEDKRLEQEGYHEFEIKIPEAYFRHPSINQFSPVSKDESEEISSFIKTAKVALNYSKDLSFVLSQLHKMEFISTFSYLEAFTESLLVEFSGKSKAEAAKIVRRESLPVLLEGVLNDVDPRITLAINTFDDQALKFISFCHRLRNLHTHNLGVVTNYFYERCLEDDFLCHDTCTETSSPETDYARLNFKFCDYVFVVGRPVNLSVISQSFRLLSREIVCMAEYFLKERLCTKRTNENDRDG
ncbi:TPA: hypothetical protein N2A34_003158 [Pseudomonas aeruginosa]|nr:hypothetical protein [Pseudomonas aeruginosa]